MAPWWLRSSDEDAVSEAETSESKVQGAPESVMLEPPPSTAEIKLDEIVSAAMGEDSPLRKSGGMRARTVPMPPAPEEAPAEASVAEASVEAVPVEAVPMTAAAEKEEPEQEEVWRGEAEGLEEEVSSSDLIAATEARALAEEDLEEEESEEEADLEDGEELAVAGGEPKPRRRRRRRRRRPAESPVDPASEEPTAALASEEPKAAPASEPSALAHREPATPSVAAVMLPELEELQQSEGGEIAALLEALVSYAPNERTTTDERNIAVFCDLENLALGIRDTEKKEGFRFDIDMVLERLLEKGKVMVKRAYADWQRYSDYKRAFHESAIELIDIPQKRYSGKNSADIKLVVDAMELCYSKDHIDTFVIVSGDSDFSPLVSKLRENDKYVIGIGMKSSTSSLLVGNCDEFIYYEDVWRDAQDVPALDHLDPKKAEAFGLMVDSILALMREGKEVLWGSMIKQTMKRKRPSFSEGYYGYGSYSELLEDAEASKIVKLRRDRRSGTYVVTGFGQVG